MTRIKICGISNAQDAQLAVELGADALGFIGVPSSPRYVPPELYREIAAGLPPFVTPVVVVHRPEDARDYRPEYVQYYTDTGVESCFRGESPQRIRAFRVRDEASLQELAVYPHPVSAVLLDGYHPDKLGGAGETFQWGLAVQAKRLTDRPVMLAGGLTPENVQAALEAVHPYGVDVASGVEARPGVKDPAKLRAFIRAVREWDMRQ
ncbi:MAG: phosphoribosylanthranilate isomerase [Armatimonadetes bacterium]|nr:phosphoribosylanthranilate isomerase [Armatimonadota bacterium]